MAYRNIPKRFDISEIAAALKAHLLYSDRFPDTIVTKIADILGKSRRTVYSVLDGAIKIDLDFLHAVVIATNGDPEVKQYLEPEGFHLVKTRPVSSDKATLAAECLDDLPALARYHQVLQDPGSTEAAVNLAEQLSVDEIRENKHRWAVQRGQHGR